MKPYAIYTILLGATALVAMGMIGSATARNEVPRSLHPRGLTEVQNARETSSHSWEYQIADTRQHAGADEQGHTHGPQTRPTVALVLGGGGLRGFAHVGVLTALEELEIQPDIIVGTSAGSVVGAVYASGLSPAEITSIALDIRIASLIDLTLSTGGLMRGNKLADWVDRVTSQGQVEQFARRFAAVATDLGSGQAVLLDSGSAGSVVQASSAVPGVNVPISYDSGHLVDGGVTSLVPVRFARAMGADIVIAVDIYCQSPPTGGIAAPAVISRVMHTQSCLIAEAEMLLADILIAPAVGVTGRSSREERERIIQSGYDAAHAALSNWQMDAKRAPVTDQ